MSTAIALRPSDLDRYVAEIKQYPLLSRDEENALAMRYHDDGNIEAAHRLVVSNLRFVVKIAHEYRGYQLPLIDLIQEGTVGLMTAVKKFDPARGYRLISYAVWWIRAYIQDFILRSWSLVKMGTTRSKRKLFFKLRSTRARLEQHAHGNEAVTTGDLASELGVSEKDVDIMHLRLAARDFSLDNTLGDDSDVSHLDQLVYDDELSLEDEVAERQERQLVGGKMAAAMEDLDPRERMIIEEHILADDPKTLQEIGNNLKVSRERVRQLESRALKKLRAAVEPLPA